MADDDSMSDDDDQLNISESTKHITSIQLGQVDIECWFHSPYIDADSSTNERDRTIDKLFICENCLRYFLHNRKYRQHMSECNLQHPPGRKIYDHPNGLSVYEVDGSTSQLYCQCLCLLAKLFLERKTIYFDVEPFLFYVLVESDKRTKTHNRIIGYFSKEKQSDEFYNVACLMVLPHRQRQGFGRFLIALSYELSKREKKMGSPEKPLSALGQMTYKSYWHSTILATLEEYRRAQTQATLTQLSIDTGICMEDILQTLIDLRLAHTNASTLQEGHVQRYRRRLKSHPENLSTNTTMSVLVIDQDALHTAMVRTFNVASATKQDQHIFDARFLRPSQRR